MVSYFWQFIKLSSYIQSVQCSRLIKVSLQIDKLIVRKVITVLFKCSKSQKYCDAINWTKITTFSYTVTALSVTCSKWLDTEISSQLCTFHIQIKLSLLRFVAEVFSLCSMLFQGPLLKHLNYCAFFNLN